MTQLEQLHKPLYVSAKLLGFVLYKSASWSVPVALFRNLVDQQLNRASRLLSYLLCVGQRLEFDLLCLTS